ncbi:MAG: NAD/NADP octopine/nopaline dehydrogenase family protein [Caldiserica bacterium]|jgi:opine dehydrogenase|nr:NAD/NADP octopine/nopaline dehydrogenase family protein [Caldisericota bacterium]
MNIAVLGAGNGGFACAADLSYRGHRVRLFTRPQTPDEIRGIQESGFIEFFFMDNPEKIMKSTIDKATTDIQEAIDGADLILNPVPAFGYEAFAKITAPHLEDGQTVITLGKGGGSLIWAKAFYEAGKTGEVYFGEINTLPYGASKMGPNLVRIESYVFEMITGSFPGKNLPKIISRLKEAYPMANVRPAENVLECILVDYNAITHTGPMVCNAGRIDSGYRMEEFHLFDKYANPPAVVRVIEAVDRERIALSKALGIPAYTLEEEIWHVKWNPKGKEDAGVLPLYEAIHTEKLEICEGPYSLKSRHLSEDVPWGLVTYSSLGKMLKVPTPVSDALITLASTLNGEDYWAQGRTVEKLGIDPSWTLEQLQEYLKEGVKP